MAPKRKRAVGAEDLMPEGNNRQAQNLVEQLVQEPWLDGRDARRGVVIAKSDLNATYLFGRSIAAGGFGRVHIITNRKNGKLFAAKVLPKQRGGPAVTLKANCQVGMAGHLYFAWKQQRSVSSREYLSAGVCNPQASW